MVGKGILFLGVIGVLGICAYLMYGPSVSETGQVGGRLDGETTSTPSKPAALHIDPDPKEVDWSLIRNDAAWTYEHWDVMSWHMFAARHNDEERRALKKKFDSDKDGRIDEKSYAALQAEWQAVQRSRELKVVDHLFEQFDHNDDEVIEGAEMAALRQAFAPYLKEKRNTAQSAWAFAVLGRRIADADGNRNFGVAEQRILSRLEESWIWPPLNRSVYDANSLNIPPLESLRIDDLRKDKSKR